MALTSPGVEVSVIDQSQYLPAPPGSVPLVVLATAQNKADASGTGVAVATTAANAGKLYQVTSQRDLVNLYGTPFFYTTTNGTPIQGYELNEYGLLAAYSLLGVTNRCYVLRADIDLASLVGQTGRPTGAPANGTYWLDSTTSTCGLFEFNATTGKFTEITNIYKISDTAQLDGNLPLQTIGQIGDYAVNLIDDKTGSPTGEAKCFFYKTTANEWAYISSPQWTADIPAVIGTESPTSLLSGSFDVSVIGTGNDYTTTVVITNGDTLDDVATYINSVLNYVSFRAEVRDDKLCLFCVCPVANGARLVIAENTGTVLTELGIAEGSYYQPMFQYGSSSQMPLWSSSQATPRPTGSVWLKVGAAGNGLNPVMAHYNTTTATWVNDTVSLYTTNWAADAALDSTGGQNIPEGTIYAQYYQNGYASGGQMIGGVISGPIYFWRRIATGPTVVTGTETFASASASAITNGGTLTVQVSLPGQTSLSSQYTVTVGAGDSLTDFVTAWSAGGVPYTTCSITSDFAIQITHTEGGEIIVSDYDATTNVSADILVDLGLVINDNTNCHFGPSWSKAFTNVATIAETGVGTDGTLNITVSYQFGSVSPTTFVDAGSGYSVGDVIKVLGTSIGGATPANDLYYKVAEVSAGALASVTYVSGNPPQTYTTLMSNWVDFDYTPNEGPLAVAPANNTNWFYSVVDQVDIMVNTTTGWRGYRNINYDSNGFPTTTGSNATDPNGPIVSASAPTLQSDGTALVYGDIWIDTSDLENYPVVYRWQLVDLEDQWVLIDNTDQISSSGILFADARWSSDQDTISPVDDPIPTIVSLLTSNNIDVDAPATSAYPIGMLLWNTRRSGYNVKQFRTNYFNQTNFPGESLPTITDTWVTVSGNQSNGAMYAGRQAQRAMVVQALRSVVDTNQSIRDEDNFFNLMATPNYPELQPNMIVLNADRGETGYIIGDTPMRLADSATDIQAWATNAAGATSTGEEGLVTRNTYLGLFYPSGIATDLNGNEVAVPSSHMMLRTFLRNDTVAYPWFAAAGTRRGTIDNALSIGYLDSASGEFQVIKTRIGIRDVLYTNFINPMVFFTGNGLLNYGNKTSFDSQSALDRTNVARLVAYIRRQLTIAARPFVFEPNDALTRNQISGVVETLMVDLVAKRGIYDYLVVCDESNNTPARIDRNELWIDVAIEPVKAVEFIYIPVRILNTGELAAI